MATEQSNRTVNKQKKVMESCISRISTLFVILLVLLINKVSSLFGIDFTSNYPLRSSININYIGGDLDGNFIVCFQSGVAGRYQGDLNTSAGPDISFGLGFDPGYYQAFRTWMTFTHGNTTQITINSSINLFISTDSLTFRTFDYDLDTPLETITVSQKITTINSAVFKVGASYCLYHAIVAQDQIVVYANSTQVFTHSLGETVLGAKLKAHWFDDIFASDQVRVNNYFIINTATNIYRLGMDSLFDYNSTILQYYYLNSSLHSHSVHAFSPLSTTSVMHLAGDYFYMQSYSDFRGYMFVRGLDLVIQPTGVPNYPINNFFEYFSTFYALHTDGLIELNCTGGSCAYVRTNTILPTDDYRIALTANEDTVVYFPGRDYILKTSDNYTQTPLPSPPISPTEPSSSYQQSTVNNTVFSFMLSHHFSRVATTFIDWLAIAISVPGARRFFTPFFYFFGIFDDLYLYQFHDRTYGPTMTNVFQQIQYVENKKWSLINYKKILSLFGTNSAEFDKIIDYQAQYATFPYSTRNHTNCQVSEGLFPNTQNYFLFSAPVCLIFFVLFKVLFQLSYHHKFFKIFRKFDFWGLLFLLLFDGNIEEFSFYLETQLTNLFSFSLHQKMLKQLVLLFGFIMLLVSVGFHLVGYFFNSWLNRYLMDNNYNSVRGQLVLIFQIGLKNLITGILQSILRSLAYSHLMAILLINQTFFCVVLLISVGRYIYRQKWKIWLLLSLNLNKSLLVLSMLCDHTSPGALIHEYVQQVLVLITVGIFIVGIAAQSSCLIRDVLHTLKLFDPTKIKNSSSINTGKKRSHQCSKSKSKNRRLKNQKNVHSRKGKQQIIATDESDYSTQNRRKINKAEVSSFTKRSRTKGQFQYRKKTNKNEVPKSNLPLKPCNTARNKALQSGNQFIFKKYVAHRQRAAQNCRRQIQKV